MLFDTQEHKDLCLKIIEATNFPGQILELAMEFKQAVTTAIIAENNIIQGEN